MTFHNQKDVICWQTWKANSLETPSYNPYIDNILIPLMILMLYVVRP